MIFVLDTSAFIVLKHFYPSTFRTLWAKLDTLAADGTLVSVREVFMEIQNYNEEHFVQEWAKQNRKIFAIPSNDELLFVREILSIPHFQALIDRKSQLKGTPVADPFVIAAAKVKGGAVVTQEKEKPNAAKIPNVCKLFGIPYMDLETFMEKQDWTF